MCIVQLKSGQNTSTKAKVGPCHHFHCLFTLTLNSRSCSSIYKYLCVSSATHLVVSSAHFLSPSSLLPASSMHLLFFPVILSFQPHLPVPCLLFPCCQSHLPISLSSLFPASSVHRLSSSSCPSLVRVNVLSPDYTAICPLDSIA